MTQVQPVKILNDLLSAELSSPIRLLARGTLHVGRNLADKAALLRAIHAESDARIALLSDLIEAEGDEPAPRPDRAALQHLAYLDTAFIQPRLAASLQDLAQRYRAAAALLGPRGADLAPCIEKLLAQARDLSNP